MVLVTSETKLTSCIIKNLKKFDISMDSFSIDEYSAIVIKMGHFNNINITKNICHYTYFKTRILCCIENLIDNKSEHCTII